MYFIGIFDFDDLLIDCFECSAFLYFNHQMTLQVINPARSLVNFISQLGLLPLPLFKIVYQDAVFDNSALVTYDLNYLDLELDVEYLDSWWRYTRIADAGRLANVLNCYAETNRAREASRFVAPPRSGSDNRVEWTTDGF